MRLIPVLTVSALERIEPEVQTVSSGAGDDTLSVLFALAQAIEQRDSGAGRHCERIATIGLELGRALGLPRSGLQALYRGGYLHDIGKVSVPDAILFKPGPLTPEEWAIMRAHTVKGEEICRGVRRLGTVIPIIRSHHERWDGSGYPDGLHGGRIPLLARILQVADIYDALTSVRAYKPALSPKEAIRILDEESRRGWRDPDVIAAFHSVWKKRLEPCGDAEAGELLPVPYRTLFTNA